jgi:hypothetical protein
MRCGSSTSLAVRLGALIFLSTGCADETHPSGPTSLPATTIEVNSVADQQGFTGDFVSENPEVLVRDGNGQPLPGITVKFAVTAGGGSVSNATTVSGPQGRATAGAWTLGPSVGVNTVVGSVDGVGSVQFRAEGVPVPSGTFQLATVDGFPLPFTDADGDDVVGGTFTLNVAKSYSFVQRIRTSDGAVNQGETSGSFIAKWPNGLSFFFNGFPWIDGTLQGDILSVGFWDYSDNLHSFSFVRETSP